MADTSTPDAPTEDDFRGQLMVHTRAELNAAAAAVGIEDAKTLPNKPAVVDAIVAKQSAAAQSRSFRLRATDDENPVHRVSFGASPRISIGAGETYTTTDPRLANRLAAQPHLEEVTP